MRPATPIRTPAPGAPPAPPCAGEKPARSSSPTRMRRRKKVDRGCLPPRRGDGPAGLVHRPGRPVPDDALPRPLLAAGGRAGPPTPRVPPRRHGEGPDAVPPGRRPGPRARRDELPQRGPAPLAEAGASGGPRGDARAGYRGGGDDPPFVGTLAGRPDHQA